MLDNDSFRRLVGSFASGVTIVTSGKAGDFHAMTASAFTSLSLEPPLVLICVDRRAQTASIIREHGSFAVNILAAGQEALSNACARSGTPESNGLHGVDFCIGPFGLPLLAGCLANFECRLVHDYDGGDHHVFAGQVESGVVDAEPRSPLTYFRGSYGTFQALASPAS